jgi:hypothetical protein
MREVSRLIPTSGFSCAPRSTGDPRETPVRRFRHDQRRQRLRIHADSHRWSDKCTRCRGRKIVDKTDGASSVTTKWAQEMMQRRGLLCNEARSWATCNNAFGSGGPTRSGLVGAFCFPLRARQSRDLDNLRRKRRAPWRIFACIFLSTASWFCAEVRLSGTDCTHPSAATFCSDSIVCPQK